MENIFKVDNNKVVDLLLEKERERQIKLGYTPEYNTRHTNKELYFAGLCFPSDKELNSKNPPTDWPFPPDTYKPHDNNTLGGKCNNLLKSLYFLTSHVHIFGYTPSNIEVRIYLTRQLLILHLDLLELESRKA